MCLFIIHVRDRTLKVSEAYCGEAKTVAPHILVKWLPDGESNPGCGGESANPVPTNFLKNHQYGSQGNFPPGNNTHFNNDFPSGNNAWFNNDFLPGSNTHFNNDLKGYNPHKEPNHGSFGGDRRNGFYNEGQFRSVPW